MDFFNDKYLHTLDPKGRLLLPREIRDEFGIKKADTLFLLPNPPEPRFLQIRSVALWEAYCEKLRQEENSENPKDPLRYARMSHQKVSVDGQGRIMIPQRLRDICELNGTLAVLSMSLYIEVWNRENMEKRYAAMVRAYKEISDRIY